MKCSFAPICVYCFQFAIFLSVGVCRGDFFSHSMRIQVGRGK